MLAGDIKPMAGVWEGRIVGQALVTNKMSKIIIIRNKGQWDAEQCVATPPQSQKTLKKHSYASDNYSPSSPLISS